MSSHWSAHSSYQIHCLLSKEQKIRLLSDFLPQDYTSQSACTVYICTAICYNSILIIFFTYLTLPFICRCRLHLVLSLTSIIYWFSGTTSFFSRIGEILAIWDELYNWSRLHPRVIYDCLLHIFSFKLVLHSLLKWDRGMKFAECRYEIRD